MARLARAEIFDPAVIDAVHLSYTSLEKLSDLATLAKVPLRDLVDDSDYGKTQSLKIISNSLEH
jgi:hypothetical protein